MYQVSKRNRYQRGHGLGKMLFVCVCWGMQVQDKARRMIRRQAQGCLKFQTKKGSSVLSAAEQSLNDVKKVGDMIRAASERCFDISECFLAKSEVLGGNIL